MLSLESARLIVMYQMQMKQVISAIGGFTAAKARLPDCRLADEAIPVWAWAGHSKNHKHHFYCASCFTRLPNLQILL